jgi:protocatechuate 3,4-dioxygenase beta subunit
MIELEMAHDSSLAHDTGLAHDLPLVRRRRMTGLAGGTTVAALAGVTLGRPELATTLAARLARSGIVRDDIRRSFGTATRVARGVPLTVRLRLVSANSGQPVAGHAVYLWQADRDGAYSLYSPGLSGENYLRGVQATDARGWVQFRSIFPGAAAGWPHLHFEVFPGLDAATDATGRLHACRMTLPADACAAVYARPDYAASRPSLTGNPAGDGRELVMAAVTGDAGRGFTAVRTLAI